MAPTKAEKKPSAEKSPAEKKPKAEIDGEGAWWDGEGDSGNLCFGWLYC